MAPVEVTRVESEDLGVFNERASEPTFSFEEMVKRLDLDGKICN